MKLIKDRTGALVYFILVFLVLGTSAAAQSLSQSDLNSIYGDTVWYQASGCDGGGGPSGGSNDEQAYNYFVQQGLTQNQAAGVVGNMKWESGVIPEQIQGGGTSPNPSDAGGGGWGIVQWTPANTKVSGVYTDSQATGPVYQLSTQLGMVWAQLTGQAGGYSETQAGSDIKSTSTIQDAVLAFQGNENASAGIYHGNYYGFERPKDESATVTRRLSLANQVLQNFGSDPVPSNGCGSGPGQDTQYVDGFTIYSQYDPSWASDSYGDTTIAAAGCGPSAMAMIVTALTGQQITPDVTAAYADSQNLYVAGEGSSWNIGPVLAAHWGLKAQALGADVSKINAALQSGALVVTSGEGPEPFTTGGHFIVIRGLTADGKWKVGDSAHSDANTQSWDPQQLISNMNGGSVYAITK